MPTTRLSWPIMCPEEKLSFSIMANRIAFLMVFLLALCIPGMVLSQHNAAYWQQQADYKMELSMDVATYRYSGTQELVYQNNSPDTLYTVYYHLYNNAFQPGSEMDIRLQHIRDPDPRMVVDGKSRIAMLGPDEIGYLRALSLKQDGMATNPRMHGTLLTVPLNTPIAPGAQSVFEMVFEGQVPVQIRRSGRNNKEGVALSMSQWYPKMAEYDIDGWHTDPYIGREFHGVWGNFDVKLTIDKDYVVGGTGYLQNPQQIGHGYQAPGTQVKRTKGKTLTWHFIAPKVHDFMWAADPDYLHHTLKVAGGPMLHFLYKNNPEILENWKNLKPKAAATMEFFNKNIGPYPYEQYSIIQGGDGGMEYPMSTLITGERKFGSLVGVTVHEIGHSWFQHLLANNELKYGWMDEGFTDFVSDLCMNQVMNQEKENPFEGAYKSYFSLVRSGLEQPQSTHADRYEFNFAYGAATYSKGAVFLAQLGYIIGQDKVMESLRKYYADYKFTHVTPNDFKRVAEKVSGIELDWYLTDWTQTTNTIDYSIKELMDEGGKTRVVLERIGLMPMPMDILVVYADGSRETLYAPLRMMRGEKDNPYPAIKRTVLPDWPWAFPTYEFTLEKPIADITAIVLDPSQLMADINLENNSWQSAP